MVKNLSKCDVGYVSTDVRLYYKNIKVHQKEGE